MRLSGIRQLYGFTLIELMVSLSIAGLLLVLAAPSYSVWLADSQIKSGAEAVAEGLRFGQAEAVKRNEQVQVVLNSTTLTGGWVAQLVSDGSTLRSDVFREAADKVQFAVVPAGNTTVTFTGLGQVAMANADATAPFDTVDVSSTVAGTRSLRVLVGHGLTGGGGIKICDLAWPATDPKGCP